MNEMQMKEAITAKVLESVEVGNKFLAKYGVSPISKPRIEFNLGGRTAGRANLGRGVLSFNLPMAMLNPAFINRTPFHEVTHLITHKLLMYKSATFPSSPRNSSHGHGKHWQFVCKEMGQALPRCHNYNVPGRAITNTTGALPEAEKMYTCTCGMKYRISQRLFNSIARSDRQRCCTKCKQPVGLAQVAHLYPNSGRALSFRDFFRLPTAANREEQSVRNEV